MRPSTQDEYRQRINRAIDHVTANLERAPDLKELAQVAAFSEFHFHRVFRAMTGETVNRLTLRLRLERATRLLRSSKAPLTEIAYACGFSSPASFSRAFREALGLSPSEYRKHGIPEDSKIRKDLPELSPYYLPMTPTERAARFKIEVKAIPARTLIYLRTTNAFAAGRVQESLKTMTDWASSEGLLSCSTLLGMSPDDPHATPKRLYRYDVCLLPGKPCDCPEGMNILELPPMLYATTRVAGDLRLVATAWDYLFRDWLPMSKYLPGPAPAQETYLDLQRAGDWAHFQLELGVPVEELIY